MVANAQGSYRGVVDDLRDTAITDMLAEHLRRGELLDLAPGLTQGRVIDKVAMTSWDGTPSIAASVLRTLLLGQVVTRLIRGDCVSALLVFAVAST